jgi:hypothetical protein
MSSATEAEIGALFYNCKDGTMLRTTLEEMGHPQLTTPIQTDNAFAAGIANATVKQRRSKAIDMRFYWVRDRVDKKQCRVHWRRGSDNQADYFSKHHSPAHHRLMHSRYLLDLHKPRLDRSVQGCVDPGLLNPMQNNKGYPNNYTKRTTSFSRTSHEDTYPADRTLSPQEDSCNVTHTTIDSLNIPII